MRALEFYYLGGCLFCSFLTKQMSFLLSVTMQKLSKPRCGKLLQQGICKLVPMGLCTNSVVSFQSCGNHSPRKTNLKANISGFNKRFSCLTERGYKPWRNRLPV